MKTKVLTISCSRPDIYNMVLFRNAVLPFYKRFYRFVSRKSFCFKNVVLVARLNLFLRLFSVVENCENGSNINWTSVRYVLLYLRVCVCVHGRGGGISSVIPTYSWHAKLAPQDKRSSCRDSTNSEMLFACQSVVPHGQPRIRPLILHPRSWK